MGNHYVISVNIFYMAYLATLAHTFNGFEPQIKIHFKIVPHDTTRGQHTSNTNNNLFLYIEIGICIETLNEMKKSYEILLTNYELNSLMIWS